MTNTVSFKIFLSLWNKVQGQSTPSVHFRMADWLEDCWWSKRRRLLMQAFRSCGKSTIVGLFAAWLLYTNPDLRIIVLAADMVLARKMVRNVKRILERHPLTQHLKPDQADQWGADRFTVKRRLELRDPSMMARGMAANMTGSRADIIICDDVEVPNTCDTADKRRDLRERLGEMDFVLMQNGTILYIGTPHSWYTIYAEEARHETGEDYPFLNKFSRLKVPILDEKGQSVWPERFAVEDIDRMRQATGPNKFASQMMLQPVNIAEGRLDPACLRFYNGDVHKNDDFRTLYLEGSQIVSCSAWWDPSFGGHGDGSVLAIIYADAEGRYFLHHISYIKTDPKSTDDEATQQCRYVAQKAKEFHVPSVTLEINGLGRFLPAILKRELAQARVPCVVREFSNSKPKDTRILEAFDAVLAARALHAHKSVQQTPFIAEMQEWRPGRSGNRDDGLDAVAGALSLEPVRLRHNPFQGRQNWTGAHSLQTAKTEFEV